MPKVQCNLNNVKEREAMQPGTYHARIVAEPEVVQSDGGTVGLKVRFYLTDPAVPEENRSYTETVWGSKEKGFESWRVKELVAAAGVPWDEDGFDTSHFVGVDLKLALKTEVYQGQMRNKIDHILVA